MCGGIGKEWFITSCWRMVKRLILTSVGNNWKDYAKQLRGNNQNWLIGNATSFIAITPNRTHRWQPVKSWKSLALYSPDFASSDYHLFRSLQNFSVFNWKKWFCGILLSKLWIFKGKCGYLLFDYLSRRNARKMPWKLLWVERQFWNV